MTHVFGSLRDIRLFVAAYEERSFTGAAQREHATQSGVSQHVKSLEDSFGTALFMRERGKIEPTPAGDAFYRRCLDVIRAHDAAGRAVRSYADGFDGGLVVGLMPTMTRCTLAPALARFVELHRNVNVRIVEGYSGALTQMVRAGELDFAIVPAFPGLSGLRSRFFLRTQELLVSSASSPLTPGAPVRLRELGPMKLVMPSRINTRRSTFETYCTTVGAEIDRVLELDAMFGTLDFVARTDWVTVLPSVMMGDSVQPTFTANPIDDPRLTLDLVMIEPARKTLEPAADVFCAMLQEEARRLSSMWDSPSAEPGGPVRLHQET
jgi:LysR family nitrogen assimilation transcriptional regulator